MSRMRDDDPLRKLVTQFEQARRDLVERLDTLQRKSEDIRAQLTRRPSHPIWPDRRIRSRLFDATSYPGEMMSPNEDGTADDP